MVQYPQEGDPAIAHELHFLHTFSIPLLLWWITLLAAKLAFQGIYMFSDVIQSLVLPQRSVKIVASS